MRLMGVAMNKFKKLAAILWMAAAHCGFGERAPQDYWEYTGKAFGGTTTFRGICIGNKTNLYTSYQLGTGGGLTNFLRQYRTSAQGTSVAFVRDTVISPCTNVLGVACDSGGTPYLLYSTNRTGALMAILDPTGRISYTWGRTQGTNDGDFGSFSGAMKYGYLSIMNDEVYIADRGNNRIQVFTTNGVFLRKWGSIGLLDGQFKSNSLTAVAASPSGNVFTLDGNGLQSFTTGGVFIKKFTSLVGSAIAVTPDGLVAFSSNSVTVIDPSDGVSWPLLSTNVIIGSDGITFSDRGDAFACNNGNALTNAHILFLERQMNDTDNPLVRNAIPHPLILSVAKRPDQPFVDIDFRVTDMDGTNVSTAIAAFEGGNRSFASMLPLRTWEGGASGKIGGGVLANTVHHVTWNASADFSGDLAEFVFKLYSIDDRGLLPFHWITIPGSGTNAPVTVASRPLSNEQMRPAWEWLIASLDPSVTLSNGQVIGASGAYSGKQLTSDLGTTADGRAFLMERLGIRALRAEELERAQGGNFGFESLSSDSVARQP